MLLSWGLKLYEGNFIPDIVIRKFSRKIAHDRFELEAFGGNLVKQQERKLEIVESLRGMPIAVETKAANEQHYELPTRFFELCLGPRLKYSCCYFGLDGTPGGDPTTKDLGQAEIAMNKLYAERAKLEEGQDVLELGCGWGSFSLWAAETYPKSNFTAVSNSATQREHIEGQCKKRNITNLKVITCDMNVFQAEGKFDRVISIEMFEHMKNYEKLLEKIQTWLKPKGYLFVHIFVHHKYAYHFEIKDDGDWISKHFFSGGTMPSDDLLHYFQKDLQIVGHWRVNGRNYEWTSNIWLENFYKNLPEITKIFEDTYPKDQIQLWLGRWRLFYLVVAEYFGVDDGDSYYVSHYLFQNNKQ